MNPAHQPETPTWTNVSNFFPRGCPCINSSLNDGLLMRNSNRDTTATTLYKVKEPVKDVSFYYKLTKYLWNHLLHIEKLKI